MAHMEMLDAGRALLVRTGEILLTVTHTDAGSLLCEARALEGFEVKHEVESQGNTLRVRLVPHVADAISRAD